MKHNTIRFVAGLLLGWAFSGLAAGNSQWVQELQKSPAGAVSVGEVKLAASAVEVTRSWAGPICTATVINHSQSPVRLARVDLFDFPHGLPGSTPMYGESFQMLAQNGGTLAALPRKVSLKNYWTGESLGVHAGEYRVPALAPHTALLIEATGTGSEKANSLTASRTE